MDRDHATAEEGLRHLIDASKAVLSVLDTDALLQVLMDRALDLTRAQRGFLMMSDERGVLCFRAGRHIERSDLDGAERMSRSVAEDVFRDRRPILSSNVRGDQALASRRSVFELQLQTVMCAPLIAKNRVLGVLYVDSNELRTRFDASSLAVFGALADLAAIALENARLYRLATTDAKTGVANAALFRARLDGDIAEARLTGSRLGLVLIDLDRFKSVNDTYGHPAGDVVLREVASILRLGVRANDLAARYGGEEFALLLAGEGPREPAIDFIAIAERLRAQIAARLFVLADGTALRVTASFGVAELGPLSDAESLLTTADRCLYEAKHQGRDRVVAAARPLPR